MLADVGSLLHTITQTRSMLSRSEQKVADYVLRNADAALGLTLAEFAQRSGVSEPTVIRFCRQVGCRGYQDFKVELAQSVATRLTYGDLSVSPTDDTATWTAKVFNAAAEAIVGAKHGLDASAIDRAVALLSHAGRIEFFGVGASGAVAVDAHHKFFRLMVPCAAHVDAHMQYMSAASLNEGDVVVAISHTGRTIELLESVELARSSGATVISITSSSSPLARLSSLCIEVNVPENTDTFTPMLSRLVHLVIIDLLAMGVARQGGDKATERLRRMKEALQKKRLSKERGGA